MFIPTLFVIACAFCDILGVAGGQDDAYEVMFRQRTRSDWEKVWHQESHSRCRDKLVRHLYWACEKDIYRLARRSGMNSLTDGQKRSISIPWIDNMSDAHQGMFRIRRKRLRNDGNSITSECCTRTGCTWEEYAEYCPSNKRIT